MDPKAAEMSVHTLRASANSATVCSRDGSIDDVDDGDGLKISLGTLHRIRSHQIRRALLQSLGHLLHHWSRDKPATLGHVRGHLYLGGLGGLGRHLHVARSSKDGEDATLFHRVTTPFRTLSADL